MYYVKGQKFSKGMIAENLQGKGIVITKYGDLEIDTTTSYYSANVLAHEILHSARLNAQSSSSKTIYDIYEIKNDKMISKDDLINDWGTGYYETGTTLNNVIKRLMQYGNTTNKTNGFDIPYGPIMGKDDVDNEGLVNCRNYNIYYKKLNRDRKFTHEDKIYNID